MAVRSDSLPPEFVKAVACVQAGEVDMMVMMPTHAFGRTEATLLWDALRYASEQGVDVWCSPENHRSGEPRRPKKGAPGEGTRMREVEE